MRAPVWIRNRIRKRQNLIVVAVVVLHDNIDKNFIALPLDHDRFRMQHLLVFAELLNEFFDAVFVEELLDLRKIVGSGRNVISVPVAFLFLTSPMTSSFCVVFPFANAM